MDQEHAKKALKYHREPRPGKLEVVATKPLETQRDLSLAYSPGVAEACRVICEDPAEAANVTARANLIGVITNGTAVLGLGDIGPLASKPVMEGKSVLFKQFANIDAFDIEIDEKDPDKFVDIVSALEPTFGGINLEDIKAPECFEIEERLKKKMNIPVFHDDQHGTAIIVAAGILNGLRLIKKDIKKVKLVASGAGAAALSCLDLLVDMGVNPKNISVCDIDGLIYKGREKIGERQKKYAHKTDKRTLDDVISNADIFLGLSAPGVLTGDMVKKMAARPLIFALANPTPEIMPEEAKKAKPDAIIATGRTDYPNQINNVLCFPFIFRGALDVGATEINTEMKIACVEAIADLAHAEASDVVSKAYDGSSSTFGEEHLIPKPFDPRLILKISPAVAKAAMDSGVATRPIKDFEEYQQKLTHLVYRSGLLMKNIFEQAKTKEKETRIVYADGEEYQVLQAVQAVIDEGIARPILVGRPYVIEQRIQRLGLRLQADKDFDIVNPESSPLYRDFWELYVDLVGRKGVSVDMARTRVRTNNTVIAALMLYRKEADAMLCGATGTFEEHKKHIEEIIGLKPGVKNLSAMSVVVMPKGTVFISDTHVCSNPDAEAISDSVFLAAEEVRHFGLTPKVALVCYSNFGSKGNASAIKMREAMKVIADKNPDFEVDGEMQAGLALSEEMRHRVFPKSLLKGAANILVMPNIDAANTSFNLLRELGGGISVGPLLLGTALPVQILTRSSTARGIFNMSALAATNPSLQE